jgi:rod shape-determining protein MreC
MEFLLNRFRNLTVLLVVVMAQLLLLAYQVKSNREVRLIRVWSVTAVTPVAKVLEVVRQNTIGVVENYFVLINVREENRKLSEELGKLKMENHFLKSELDTADRAQALQAFQARTPSRTIPARVIGTGTGANSRVVYVDQGTGAGIIKGMAVVTPDGIVGKVLESYPTASQVLLVTDPSFGAGVTSQKNRVHGTLKGLGQSKCSVDYVENEEKVEVGEMFYTSGDDRVFPKGMPVGRATVVREGKNFKEIFVVPAGLQNGVEEVLIVVQGEHQAIPEASQAVASSNIYMMPRPQSAGSASTAPTVLATDADRMRDTYKEVGAAQGHKFGEGGPGSRPPNFNLRVEAPKPATPTSTPQQLQAGQPGAGAPSAPAAQAPSARPAAPIVGGQSPVAAGGQPAPAAQPIRPPAATSSAGQPATGTQPITARPKVPGAPERQPITSRPAPTSTAGQATTGAQPITSRPKPQAAPDGQPITSRPAATGTAGQATTGTQPITPGPKPQAAPDGQPITSRPAATGATGQANTGTQPITSRPKPQGAPDGQPITSRPPATATTAPPTTARPKPQDGADGQPVTSRPKPPITVNPPPTQRPARTTNDTTINVITPAPSKPAVAKPKPERSDSPNP